MNKSCISFRFIGTMNTYRTHNTSEQVKLAKENTMNEVNTMDTHKDCYMHTELCDSLDTLRDALSYWSNYNDTCVIVSHSVSLHGTSYLLSIVYYYIEY